MQLEMTVVDAFTDTMFSGNPAAVIILDEWLPEHLMQSIAAENNLSETAFLVPHESADYQIRWFSPLTEIDFCGHASLAAAFVIFSQDQACTSISFFANAVDVFSIKKLDSGKIEMNFPNTKPEAITDIPEQLTQGLSIAPQAVFRNQQAYFVLYQTEAEVLAVQRDNLLLAALKPLDVVVTCHSESGKYDFVSRYFWPANGGDEDPVTGSIHTGLAPFWAERLGKNQLIAYQASQRGGVLDCQVIGDRVLIAGQAVQYLKGTISL